MASPKAIVQTLNEYFDLIERLALKSRSSNALYEQMIFDEAIAYFQQNKEEYPVYGRWLQTLEWMGGANQGVLGARP